MELFIYNGDYIGLELEREGRWEMRVEGMLVLNLLSKRREDGVKSAREGFIELVEWVYVGLVIKLRKREVIKSLI